MVTLRRSISSLSALASFEAAARLESFTLAAAELGVTQAAVSRQVKLLETELNQPLFLRAHRKVTLTPAGAALAATVTSAFGRMAEMIETIRQPVVPNAVTIGATLAFSHLWLLPRLAAFRLQHPDINLKLVADDSPSDLRRDRLDAAIRYGQAPFPDGRSIASLPDEVFPVCSPKLLNGMSPRLGAIDIAKLPLIAQDTVNPSWLNWRSWAKEAGLGAALGTASDRSRLRFSHYTDTVQAAVNGEGIALGWATLISAPLSEGKLVRVVAHSVRPKEEHHVLIPLGREPSPPAAAFLAWMSERLTTER